MTINWPCIWAFQQIVLVLGSATILSQQQQEDIFWKQKTNKQKEITHCTLSVQHKRFLMAAFQMVLCNKTKSGRSGYIWDFFHTSDCSHRFWVQSEVIPFGFEWAKNKKKKKKKAVVADGSSVFFWNLVWQWGATKHPHVTSIPSENQHGILCRVVVWGFSYFVLFSSVKQHFH